MFHAPSRAIRRILITVAIGYGTAVRMGYLINSQLCGFPVDEEHRTDYEKENFSYHQRDDWRIGWNKPLLTVRRRKPTASDTL